MADVPDDVADEVVRLTRLMDAAVDDAEIDAYRERRNELLEPYDVTTRIRSESTRDVLVCYPEEWVTADGTVRTEQIEDLDRAVERPLSGPGNPDDWDELAEHNRTIARTVRDQHGDVHGDNAEAFAEYMNNHCAKRIENAAREDVERFLTEYFVRNCWPTDRQQSLIDESVEKTFAAAGVPDPRSPA